MRPLIARVCPLLASLILVLGIFEIGLRIMYPPADFAGDRQLARRFHPDQRFRSYSSKGEFDMFSVYNSVGMRDREHPRKSPAGTRRMIVIGDSFTEGTQVALAESFPARLEVLLGEKLPSDVINAGHSGFGPSEEYLVLRHFGVERDPDLVIQAFFVNDLWDEVHSAHQIIYDEHGVPVRMKGPPLELLRFVVNRLRMIWWSSTTHRDMSALLRGPLNTHYMTEEYWQAGLRVIEATAALAREAGARYFLVIVPVKEQVATARAKLFWIEDIAWGVNGFGRVGQVGSFAKVIR